ncbi:preprotein translocase subunit SecF [Ferrithrix thermotolerans DSM 19514]|uniref:Protein-export membrane protein SecF n=1 Tax=Ferrithrix thermotolerans DSM 19514 TaxID=1121881 RepID=A0A1M4SHE0_9ACTN|nr:protein translocase subunit SecF [Ferrithrix thermotolerans]SHE31684.1 preprotein translocase subunit SecF [Ferrithrix thermotolerans DSM 19514]
MTRVGEEVDISAESGVGEVVKDEKKGRPSFFHSLSEGETSFRFLRRRKVFYTISILIIVLGGISIGVRGLNFGIDFKGGTSWQVPSPSLTVSKAQAVLRSDGITQATVYTLGTGANRSLEAEADLSSLSPSAQSAKERQVSTDLAKAGGVSFSSVSLTNVGPTWGSDVTSKALEALAFFFLGIVLYISVRFEWKMALAALVAVVHDLLVTVGIYSISNFQITPATVIAVLTILGYSLYDTIVVFDRVQENVKTLVNPGRLTYDEAVDLSLNQVLMRSLNTSLVAIIPVLSILVVGAYILGATTLQDFGLALFVGLTTGAYSSIAIASPVLAWLKGREPRYKALAARLGERSTHLSTRSVAQGALSQGVGGASSDTARPPRPRSSNSKRKARSKR